MHVTNKGRVISLALTAVFAAGSLLALDVDKLPPDNWTVPSSRAGIRTTMTDATSPRAFIGLTPCRIVDTRGNGAPIQGGTFAANQVRTWALSGKCGIPTGADAVSLNLTVTGTGASPFGFATLWPTGATQPTASNINWSAAGQTIANAVIVPLGTSGSVNVISGNAGTDMVLDVNGYFSSVLGSPGNYFRIDNNSGLFSGFFVNNSTTCGGACGVVGETFSTNAGGTIAGYFASEGATGPGVGVRGDTFSVSGGATGVFGQAGDGPSGGLTCCISSGVLGTSQNGIGVLGLVENSGSNTYGVLGRLQTSTGTLVTFGVLGFRSGTTNYGVFSGGDFGGSGAKFFVEPHPTDPTKVIRYVALEGPQPQTFFNGRGRFQGGVAQISVPEDFRLVTDAEGLVVQVTPIGEMASIAVLKADLDSIVVKSSRNVEFFYTVNGIRRTMKDLVPIMNGTEFMPESPSARMPDSLAPAQKQMLISNGTYNADGSANLETAERVGWTKIWQEREEAAKAAAAANAKATQQRLADQAAAATKN